MNAMERINQLADAREAQLKAERENKEAKENAAQKKRNDEQIATTLKVLIEKLGIQPGEVLGFNGQFVVLRDFEITFSNLTDQGDRFYVYCGVQIALPPELEDEEEQYEWYAPGQDHYTTGSLAVAIRDALETIKNRIEFRWDRYNANKNTEPLVGKSEVETPAPQVGDELRRLIKQLVYEALEEFHA